MCVHVEIWVHLSGLKPLFESHPSNFGVQDLGCRLLIFFGLTADALQCEEEKSRSDADCFGFELQSGVGFA